MTLEEAKKFYFDYNGYSFHMDREEPLKYNAFCRLRIGKDVLKEWDEELLEEKFERMQTCPERAWTAHGDILKIMRRGNCDISRYAD
ncbi:MAG: hypothetical protein IJL97_01895, partial [Lachnospiraceae bacterium]|nr:hypothetical protein [Lachnospiraceae bacterium]